MQAIKAVWWLLSLALMGLMWFLSSSGDPIGVPLPHPLDWIGHFTEYAVLGFLLGRATGRRDVGWLLAAWFGAVDEVHQAYVPGREAGIGDWWFDLAGSWLGSRLGRRRVRTPPSTPPPSTPAPPPIDLDFRSG